MLDILSQVIILKVRDKETTQAEGNKMKSAQEHLARLEKKGWKITLKSNGNYKLVAPHGWNGTFSPKDLVKWGHKLGN